MKGLPDLCLLALSDLTSLIPRSKEAAQREMANQEKMPNMEIKMQLSVSRTKRGLACSTFFKIFQDIKIAIYTL